jgi:uncharacterized protein (DUF1697 family)
MAVYIVLLRAIGPITHKIMTMKQLEAACQAAGLVQTRNLLATGNLVIASDWPVQRISQAVESILHDTGLKSVVFIRAQANLAAIVAANPNPGATETRPSGFQVVFLERRPDDQAVETLRQRAQGERIDRIIDDVCIDYGGGISNSKLTPGLVERILGSVSTSRNWNTVLKLLALSERMAATL